jgi:hypothetical protein
LCLNERFSKARAGKYLTNNFLIQNDLKQTDAFSYASSFVLVREPDGIENEWVAFSTGFAEDIDLLRDNICTMKKLWILPFFCNLEYWSRSKRREN